MNALVVMMGPQIHRHPWRGCAVPVDREHEADLVEERSAKDAISEQTNRDIRGCSTRLMFLLEHNVMYLPFHHRGRDP